jgi:uncharacterized membrane protein YbhN (UPF0104 family)
MRRSLWRTLGAYFAAALLVWYCARGIDFAGALEALRQANLALFISVSLVGFLVWFFGESLLFSCLFSYFHQRTEFSEIIPANAAYYFLQLINLAAANGALMVFLNRRKGASWGVAGFILLFQGFLDVLLLAAMTLLAVLLGLDSPLNVVAPYAAVVLLMGLLVIAFFSRRRPESGLVKRIYEWPTLSGFRAAQLSHYGKLTLIRAIIFLIEGFVLYGELQSFHIRLSLYQALLFSPVSLLVGSLPLAPAGLGTLQLVLVKGLAGFAPKAALLTAGLAISVVNLLWRLPLGLLSADFLAGRSLAKKSDPAVSTL